MEAKALNGALDANRAVLNIVITSVNVVLMVSGGSQEKVRSFSIFNFFEGTLWCSGFFHQRFLNVETF